MRSKVQGIRDNNLHHCPMTGQFLSSREVTEDEQIEFGRVDSFDPNETLIAYIDGDYKNEETMINMVYLLSLRLNKKAGTKAAKVVEYETLDCTTGCQLWPEEMLDAESLGQIFRNRNELTLAWATRHYAQAFRSGTILLCKTEHAVDPVMTFDSVHAQQSGFRKGGTTKERIMEEHAENYFRARGQNDQGKKCRKEKQDRTFDTLRSLVRQKKTYEPLHT